LSLEDGKFQIYFAGGKNKHLEPFLHTHGCNRLASQLLDRGVISEWITKRNEDKELCTGYLFLDSGAFSAHTKDAEVDVDAYINYVNSMDEDVHIFAQVDKIPGKFHKPKTPEQLAEAPEQSWKNYLYMRERVKSPDKLLPIFHQGEEYKWLENILETTFDGKHIPYIGISPANDKLIAEKEVFIENCFRIIEKSSNPDVKTHAFGMTTLRVLENYPFTSADSITWIKCGAVGGIFSKYGVITLSKGIEYSPAHINKQPKDVQEEVSRYVESFGYTLEELSEDYRKRVIFNAEYLLRWCKNYKYAKSTVSRRSLF
jgi:sarcosine oxidase delta subunit